MARIRTVKPETFSSYSLAEVSIEARFLFIGIWTEVDDDGRMIDAPRRILGAIFPHDAAIDETHVRNWIDELERVGCVARYCAKGGKYLDIPNWLDHQKISHPTPSKLPSREVPEELPIPPEVLAPEQGTGNREREQGTGKALEVSRFEDFWRIYPRREAKQAALKAFTKATKTVDAELIILGAARFRDDPNRDPAFTPHPATWLNAGRWDDEPAPSRARAPADRNHDTIARTLDRLMPRTPGHVEVLS